MMTCGVKNKVLLPGLCMFVSSSLASSGGYLIYDSGQQSSFSYEHNIGVVSIVVGCLFALPSLLGLVVKCSESDETGYSEDDKNSRGLSEFSVYKNHHDDHPTDSGGYYELADFENIEHAQRFIETKSGESPSFFNSKQQAFEHNCGAQAPRLDNHLTLK